MNAAVGEVTRLLHRASNAQDKEAWAELYRRVERDLLQAAHALRARMSPHRTFQTTELVNEAFCRLLEADKEWVDRQHYIRTAIAVMRNKIIDYARKRKPCMLNSKEHREALAVNDSPDAPLLEAELWVQFDQALERLAASDSVAHEVFVLRYFGAYRFYDEQASRVTSPDLEAKALLTLKQVSEMLDMPPSTVESRWKKAQLFLARELTQMGVACG